MRIDFSQPIVIGGGLHIEIAPGKNSRLGDICRASLNAPLSDAKKASVEDMVRRGMLAMKVADCGDLDVSPEEVAMIREGLPSAVSNVEVIAVVYNMLDPQRGSQ